RPRGSPRSASSPLCRLHLTEVHDGGSEARQVFSSSPVPPGHDLAQSHPGLLPFVEAGTGADAMLAYLQGLLTCAGGVMYVRDLCGRMLLANHGFEELVGRPVREIVGRTSSDLFG